jgi:predicted deacylase
VGIDLHTAANRRMNVPQIRTSLRDPVARRLGLAFGAPYLIDAALRPGSLRDAADREGVPVLTFEGGQSLVFEDDVIEVGVTGVLRVMGAMGMLGETPGDPATRSSRATRRTGSAPTAAASSTCTSAPASPSRSTSRCGRSPARSDASAARRCPPTRAWSSA